MTGLYALSASQFVAWIGVTLVLGGAAALAVGRAIGHAWRPLRGILLPCFALSLATAFLCYALFGIAIFPVTALAVAAWSDRGALPGLLAPWFIGFVALALLGYVGWRLTRSRQMLRQYAFLSREPLSATQESGHSAGAPRRF